MEKKIPQYGTVKIGNYVYYRTAVRNLDGKNRNVYGRTCEEVYEKAEAARNQIGFLREMEKRPTVEFYCRKWLFMQSTRLARETLINYTSKMERYIIEPLGHLYMDCVSADDIKMAMVKASGQSAALYRRINMLVKSVFRSAQDSGIIEKNPTEHIPAEGGHKRRPRESLTDEQAQTLLAAIRNTRLYPFVMLGLYAGLRREEILGLRWTNVHLDDPTPYLFVCEAWHGLYTDKPYLSSDLKTPTSRRVVPIPKCLERCLTELKANSKSQFVISNKEGKMLSYGQFRSLWNCVGYRSVGEKTYSKYINGVRIIHKYKAQKGAQSKGKKDIYYTIDFRVSPHTLRHTYITNLIAAHVDPKTVQYLVGHKSSKTTMDVYARVKYNKPEDLSEEVRRALDRK